MAIEVIAPSKLHLASGVGIGSPHADVEAAYHKPGRTTSATPLGYVHVASNEPPAPP